MQNPFKNGLPPFKNSEVKVLYSEDVAIATKKLQAILDLPKDELIADLGMLLEDVRKREELLIAYLDQNSWPRKHTYMVFHALSILSRFPEERSFQLIREFFKSSQESLDLWLGDHITETSWWWLLPYTKGMEKDLKNWVLDTEVYEFARVLPLSAMSQLFHFDKESRKHVEKWFEDVFMDLFSLKDNLTDEGLTTLDHVIADLIILGQKQYLPLITQLYHEQLVNDFMLGPLEDTKADIGKPFDPKKHGSVYYGLDLFSFYKKISTSWSN